MLLLCYSRCSTCKKALKWVEEQQIPCTVRDIREENPSETELRAWHEKSGLPLKKFFNTSGQQYRALGLSQKLPSMTEDEQFALLASDGMLVKRPLVILEDRVLVGFQEDIWTDALRK